MIDKPEITQSDMAKEIKAMADQSAAEATALEAIKEPSALDADIDVPEVSSFWDRATAPPKEEEGAEAAPGEEPEAPPSETIRFKANGEEQEISLEDARKKLAMVEGGAKAFSQLAQANKRIKELESANDPDTAKKVALMDKLESLKHDDRALIQIITGKDPDEYLAELLRKERIRETGTDVDIRTLEREEEFAQLKRELEAQRERQEEHDKRESARLKSSETSELKGLVDQEFFKHKFETGDETDSNDMNEMLYTQGRHRMSQYVKKYQSHDNFKQLLPKIVEKSFTEVAGKLQRLTTGSVQSKVDEAIAAKRQTAKEQAALASTRRLTEPRTDDFKGLGPREIAEKLTGNRGKFLW